jgi:hypothetical protein
MITHAVSMATLFVDQVSQAPVVVRCTQAPPELWWKWLAQSLFQVLLSIIPVAGGVWIALWSFRRTRELTEWSFQATAEKEHERWVLDQRRAEWRELLFGLSETFREYMPPYMSDETAERFIRDVGNIQRRTDRLTMPFIFINQCLEDQKFHSRIEEFRALMLEQGEIMQSALVYKHFPGQANSALQDAYGPVVRNYDEVIKFVREMAEKDMALSLGKRKLK